MLREAVAEDVVLVDEAADVHAAKRVRLGEWKGKRELLLLQDLSVARSEPADVEDSARSEETH